MAAQLHRTQLSKPTKELVVLNVLKQRIIVEARLFFRRIFIWTI